MASVRQPRSTPQPMRDIDLNRHRGNKTLPLPSIVEVTNLKRPAMRLRVNDRGLSSATASSTSPAERQLLGFERWNRKCPCADLKEESVRLPRRNGARLASASAPIAEASRQYHDPCRDPRASPPFRAQYRHDASATSSTGRPNATARGTTARRGSHSSAASSEPGTPDATMAIADCLARKL